MLVWKGMKTGCFVTPDCGGQDFLQNLTGRDEKRRMTPRCATYILLDQGMARSSMNEVARSVGVDEKPSGTFSMIVA